MKATRILTPVLLLSSLSVAMAMRIIPSCDEMEISTGAAVPDNAVAMPQKPWSYLRVCPEIIDFECLRDEITEAYEECEPDLPDACPTGSICTDFTLSYTNPMSMTQPLIDTPGPYCVPNAAQPRTMFSCPDMTITVTNPAVPAHAPAVPAPALSVPAPAPDVPAPAPNVPAPAPDVPAPSTGVPAPAPVACVPSVISVTTNVFDTVSGTGNPTQTPYGQLNVCPGIDNAAFECLRDELAEGLDECETDTHCAPGFVCTEFNFSYVDPIEGLQEDITGPYCVSAAGTAHPASYVCNGGVTADFVKAPVFQFPIPPVTTPRPTNPPLPPLPVPAPAPAPAAPVPVPAPAYVPAPVSGPAVNAPFVPPVQRVCAADMAPFKATLDGVVVKYICGSIATRGHAANCVDRLIEDVNPSASLCETNPTACVAGCRHVVFSEVMTTQVVGTQMETLDTVMCAAALSNSLSVDAESECDPMNVS